MKKLLICRHGKSFWGDPNLTDHQRPLAKRGLHDAPMMAKRAHSNHIIPEKILSSDALRAKMTAAYYLKSFEKLDIIYEISTNLYMTSVEEHLDEVKKTSNKIDTLFIFGHNPTLTLLINYFGEKLENLPTGAVFGFKFNVEDWKDIAQENAEFWMYDYPKNLSTKTS
ncbi:SixA phosphatase family protein [Cyclobacterium marinum]|uniref:Putative phosphohistidine phosphatase, SixA n=1 Tax=Cyclobacterium marinum (strain ATCC 25205 / DSM 745 / LMG 13164 / NCIMB 1802) TaxID=880070 RepID=G0IZ25_CYCMS|nr:histidine phosphatase family protein [Cyclobacterium marinum]AEL23804.1 putative phosphohistidine phosphatase, SixA [Cyclobacterium marinum DSM 745]